METQTHGPAGEEYGVETQIIGISVNEARWNSQLTLCPPNVVPRHVQRLHAMGNMRQL